MGILALTGQLVAGPPGSGLGNFPASQFQDGLLLGVAGSQGMPYTYSADSTSRMVNSPSSFVAIPGIGAGADVQRVDTLYFKCDAPLVLELTTDDGSGGSVVSTVPVSGVFLQEFPEANALTGLRVKGSARITFFACGLS